MWISCAFVFVCMDNACVQQVCHSQPGVKSQVYSADEPYDTCPINVVILYTL